MSDQAVWLWRNAFKSTSLSNAPIHCTGISLALPIGQPVNVQAEFASISDALSEISQLGLRSNKVKAALW
jgi:hypothetical protein